MIEAVRNAFKIPDLRKKLIFTIIVIALYRFGASVPVPGVDIEAVKELFKTQGGGILGFMDIFAGGALSKFAVFSLGIMPYITAAIIMELLTVVIPQVEKWAKEGETGRKRITLVTRYMGLALYFIESVGLTFFFQSQLKVSFPPLTKVLIITSLTAGGILIMWMGELITQKGIGNGMSLLIFISILARFPESIAQTLQVVNPALTVATILILVAVTVGIIIIEGGQRRIPVQYAKRIVGRKVYQGAATYIPLKLNPSGVIPIIFAASILMFPAMITRFIPGEKLQVLSDYMAPGGALYLAFFAVLIVFFTYFYTSIVFNPIDVADNLKKYGGFIPGVRPGKPTAAYIDHILGRIILPGSLFLAFIAVLPTILMVQLNVPLFAHFGGIALLIIVGVALETVKQIEAQLLMRHYEGILK